MTRHPLNLAAGPASEKVSRKQTVGMIVFWDFPFERNRVMRVNLLESPTNQSVFLPSTCRLHNSPESGTLDYGIPSHRECVYYENMFVRGHHRDGQEDDQQ